MSSASRRTAPDERGVGASTVDHGLLGALLGHAIARANLASEATFHTALEDRSVTPQRFSLLELVGSNPGLQQVQLADALGLSRPAVTLLIDYWQARGCVERRSEPNDRRSFGIFLTREGTAALADLRRRALVHDGMLTKNLSEGERRELCRLLEKLQSDKDLAGN